MRPGPAVALGRFARELATVRGGVAAALAFACLTTLALNFSVGLLPPRLEPRAPELAGASTQVLVDSPRSSLVDLRQDSYGLDGLSRRAVLMGTLLASPPVRERIARRAGIDPRLLRTSAPLTPEQSRALEIPGSEPRVTDLVRGTQSYSLSFRVHPSVPVVDIYAEAPDPEAAASLADAAVAGLADYLAEVAARERTAPEAQVELRQLGPPSGGVVNDGVGLAWATLTFALAFAVAGGALVLWARIRRGWRAAPVRSPAGGRA